MSVDFYACDSCGDAIYEENIVSCESCGRNICDGCTVGEGDFFDDMRNEDGYLKEEHCPFCTGNEIHIDDLMDFALDRLDMTKEQLEIEYAKTKGGTI